MKQLELNLEKIALIGAQKEEENFDFRVFLKGLDVKQIDKIVHRIDKELRTKIDCTKCGNCCKSLRPCVTDSELDKLSQIDNLPQPDFVNGFVKVDDLEGIKYLKDTPCKYLYDKSCSIYSNRPEDCKSYPHTQKAEFVTRTLGMIENYGICPIVFNLFEQLKEELHYK
ncbi:YkgJ family cysteine cluster protein [Yeosuana marina]|uniref:YkgJ family cysteine cluster protein n=1 Tax=Yeosuana marina TaxID=1565536 RepID=UPI0030EF1E4B|tara:strand:+ start:536 stop:1042 length:507 start_codon:yes stop_codon:yes gene_type:complete